MSVVNSPHVGKLHSHQGSQRRASSQSRLHIARDKVSDWLDADNLGVNASLECDAIENQANSFQKRSKADTAARSMSDHMQRPVCYRDLKTSSQNYIHRVWQETWDQQILNKLHNIHPSTSHWAALPMRRHDVRLTRLRIGHTRFTHRHLLLGENAPECPSCKVPYSVYHILIDCPIFNHHRITFFHTSVLTLSDFVGELPTQTFLPSF
ncbi:RNase H domain-containing protein [Trichonephila clavipes]|nr:RNase H domain-containing protein [Trichonephila clavipes]